MKHTFVRDCCRDCFFVPRNFYLGSVEFSLSTTLAGVS